MRQQQHLMLPLTTGIYIAVLIVAVQLASVNLVAVSAVMMLAYIIANIAYEVKIGKLETKRISELLSIVLISQYLILFT